MYTVTSCQECRRRQPDELIGRSATPVRARLTEEYLQEIGNRGVVVTDGELVLEIGNHPSS